MPSTLPFSSSPCVLVLRVASKLKTDLLITLVASFSWVLVCAQVSHRQALKTEYRFQNNGTSTVGSASLSNSGAVSNTFQPQFVDRTMRPLLRIGAGSQLLIGEDGGRYKQSAAGTREMPVNSAPYLAAILSSASASAPSIVHCPQGGRT